MTRVKICGNKSREDVEMAVNAGADAVGFVTEVPVDTHRNLSSSEAKHLVEDTPPFVTTVAVIMPEDLEEAVDLADETSADVIQVHSGLNPGEMKELSRRESFKTVRKVENSFEKAKKFEESADSLLIDSSGEKGGGGTGRTVNQKEAAEIVEKISKPVILAGGLTAENVSERIDLVSPYAVDVASGVEKDKSKDPGLVEKFVGKAKNNKGKTFDSPSSKT